jgi:Tol biopolymer transport system component
MMSGAWRMGSGMFLRWTLAVAVAILALAACQGWPVGAPDSAGGPIALPLSGPVPDAPGRLLYVKSGAFWTLEPRTKATAQLAALPPGSFASQPAVSPDGRWIAYVLYQPGQAAGDPGGTSLHVMSADGQERRVVLAHDGPGIVLSEPAWSHDGQALYFTRQATDGTARVERVRLDGSGRALIIADGHSPSVSAEGQRLAYLVTDPQRLAQTLWIAGADGAGAVRLLGDPDFMALARPALARDGRRIAFSAVGGPAAPAPGRQGRWPAARFAWLEPRIAEAHGIPWDVWVVGSDGTGLHRLTDLAEDMLVVTWSADGRWIAFSGELGIYLVDAGGREVRRLSADYAEGGLAWLPH